VIYLYVFGGGFIGWLLASAWLWWREHRIHGVAETSKRLTEGSNS
jgi:hypothetical protein